MLILVAVTINMAINGGLFSYAGRATRETQDAIDAEKQLGEGKIEIGGIWYNSIDEYLLEEIMYEKKATATMTQLYNYYVLSDTENGYQLQGDNKDIISIENKTEFEYLAKYTNEQHTTENVTFMLIKDIDLNPGTTISKEGDITGTTPKEWEAIGKMVQVQISNATEYSEKVAEYGTLYREGWSSNYSQNKYYYGIAFKGRLIGYGHTIKGVYCNETTKENFGLFGVVDGAEIGNLNITNSYISAGESSSPLIGKAIGEGVTLYNINSTNNYIKVNADYSGGVIGRVLAGDTILKNIASNNKMLCEKTNFYSVVGGIAGSIGGNKYKIEGCTNYTNIGSEIRFCDYVGGIAGYTDTEEGILENCVNNGNLKSVWGETAGLIGELNGKNNKVYGCYNTGNIEGNLFTGGLIGLDVSDKLEIYNCHNSGNIIAFEEEAYSLGGLIGQCRADILMYDCYNMGDIISDSSNIVAGGIGGLIGQNNEGFIYNCYNAGNINMYIYPTTNMNPDSLFGIGGLIGECGSNWGSFKMINCFSICNLTLNWNNNKTVERIVVYGEIVGSVYENVTVENCYGYSTKSINLPENVCEFTQNIGGATPHGSEFEGTKTITGYLDTSNSYPSVAINAEQITQNIQEVATYKSQEFCDLLNDWVNNNNQYSKWLYDPNKNDGLPYLEVLKDTIE